MTNTSGQFNLWRISVGGGRQQQLTAFEENTIRSVAPSPDGKTIVITADHDGDEFHQIYSLPSTGGWPEQWTEAPQVQHFVSQEGWSPDGSRLAFAANARIPTDMDIWLRDADGNVSNLFGEGMYAFPASWSRDGGKLLALDFRSNTDTTLHLIDVGSGDSRELTPHEGEVKYIPGPWAKDGSGFYLLADEGREYSGLAFLRLDGGLEWVATPEGDIEEVAMSEDGRVLGWIENDRGWARLHLRDLDTGSDLPEPQLPAGSISPSGSALRLAPGGAHAALVWQGPQHPPDLYTIETATGKAQADREHARRAPSEASSSSRELISYPSFDGREIPAWLYRPSGVAERRSWSRSTAAREAQERPVYQPLYQYLVSRGIAVLATNIRGSTRLRQDVPEARSITTGAAGT